MYSIRLLLLFVIIPSTILANSQVLFLNPGGIGDPFFQKMTDFMYLAAEDLDIDLEVIYCDRNHIKLETELLNAIDREVKPEYLLLINEKNAVAPYLSKVDSAEIYYYLFNEGVLVDDTTQNKDASGSSPYWLGELLPNDYNAGELLAEQLYTMCESEQNGNDSVSVIGLAGVIATSSSITREQGFADFFEEKSNTTIHQVVPAYHDREKAIIVTSGLLDRYGTVDLIWAASDIMALGAYEACGSESLPVIGGVDWSDEAIESIEQGRLSVSVGGHFLDGARVLLSIAQMKQQGDRRRAYQLYRSSFSIITESNHAQFSPFFGSLEKWHSVDFSQFIEPTIVPEEIPADLFLKAYEEANE